MTDTAPRLDPAPAEAPCAATFPVFGIPTRFESNSPEVIRVAEEAFGAWSVLEREPSWIFARPVRVKVEVAPGDEGAGGRARVEVGLPRPTRMVLTTPGSRAWADAALREAAAEVTEALVRDREHFRSSVVEALTLFLLSRLDREPLHAAAVARGGAALLLAGRSGVGKSTLVYAAARSGLGVMAEDAVFLQLRPFRVWGMPGHVHLTPASRAFFPELEGAAPTLRANGKTKIAVSLRALGAVAPRLVAERAGVCLLARGDGRPRLERLSSDEVARALTARLEPGFDHFAASIGERIRPLAERGGWRMTLPDFPPDALPLLHEMLDALEAG